MPQTVLIKRTSTPNSPPVNNSLQPGELAVEMAVPTRLWVGVPAALDATGRKLLTFDEAPIDGTTYARKDAGWVRGVAVAGDTMTGNLIVQKTSPAIQLDAPSMNSSGFHCLRNGALRWALGMSGLVAESGGNVGSAFELNSFDDAGNFIVKVVDIDRKTNEAVFTGGVQSNGFYGTSFPDVVIYGSSLGVGSIYLRPKGLVDTTSQASLDTLGNFIVSLEGYKPGGGAWIASSDARIKTVLGDYDSGLDEVLALQPVRYVYSGNDTPTGSNSKESGPYQSSPHYSVAITEREFVGLVAQDAEVAMPELVQQSAGFINGEPVPDLRSVNTTPLLFALVNAVKTLTERIEALEGATR